MQIVEEIMEKFLERLRLGLPSIIYFTIYMIWFNHIESIRAAHYTVIHMSIDDKIPFCEFFIVPYYMWFIYVVGVVLFLLFTDRKEYMRIYLFLTTGMTIFLVISTLFPNIQHLRPYTMPRDNVFSAMVLKLYSIDTPTNLWPSIHVYNSIGAYIGVAQSKKLSANKWVRNASLVLSVLIILSTLFLKQHSMFDVLTAFVMAAVVYAFVYRFDVLMSVRNAYILRKEAKEGKLSVVK